jgi:hypothetical protein
MPVAYFPTSDGYICFNFLPLLSGHRCFVGFPVPIMRVIQLSAGNPMPHDPHPMLSVNLCVVMGIYLFIYSYSDRGL